MDEAHHIKSHFKKADSAIYRVLKGMTLELLPHAPSPEKYFSTLCREIITQQLGTGAARAINGRFLGLFSDQEVTPERILTFTEQNLRNVGMSWAKARYILDLARKTNDGALDFTNLHTLDDEGVIGELTKVKGIGRWTAEMFLIFTLGREDIFSHGDLGLKRGIKLLYGFPEVPKKEEIEQIISVWSPYKSYASIALWESLDNKKE